MVNPALGLTTLSHKMRTENVFNQKQEMSFNAKHPTPWQLVYSLRLGKRKASQRPFLTWAPHVPPSLSLGRKLISYSLWAYGQGHTDRTARPENRKHSNNLTIPRFDYIFDSELTEVKLIAPIMSFLTLLMLWQAFCHTQRTLIGFVG